MATSVAVLPCSVLIATEKLSVIHQNAIIDSNAIIGDNVSIGPWTYIGPDVEIGDNCVIASHVVIKGPTVIGSENTIFQFSSVGEDTPDLKYQGEVTKLIVGNNNTIREGVTIHRGTVQDNGETVIGNNTYSWLMSTLGMIVSWVTTLL